MSNQVMVNEKNGDIINGDAASIMALIARAAADPNVDIPKMERLEAMYERALGRTAKQAYSADFVRMKPHLPTVERTKDNIQTKSKYAPLENINEQIDPVLKDYGFATATKVLSQTADSVTVKAELWHSGGHVEETIVTMPLDNKGMQGTVNKTLPHATASSITYAKRVAICALLNISTGDDKDGQGPPDNTVLDNARAVEIDLLISEVKADKSKFLNFMGVDSVQKIKASDYKKALNALNAKKKKPESKNAAA